MSEPKDAKTQHFARKNAMDRCVDRLAKKLAPKTKAEEENLKAALAEAFQAGCEFKGMYPFL